MLGTELLAIISVVGKPVKSRSLLVSLPPSSVGGGFYGLVKTPIAETFLDT